MIPRNLKLLLLGLMFFVSDARGTVNAGFTYQTIDVPFADAVPGTTQLTGINNSGQIIGFYGSNTYGLANFVLDSSGFQVVNPGVFVQTFSGINDSGQYVGTQGAPMNGWLMRLDGGYYYQFQLGKASFPFTD